MKSLDKIKQYNFGERIEDYKKSLKYFRKAKLQEMMISLDDSSRFSDFYSVNELSNFEKQYGVPIKTGKDLEYFTFAVADKLQELDKAEKQEELREKEVRKIGPKIRKVIAATALAASLAGLVLQPCQLPMPSKPTYDHVINDEHEGLFEKIRSLNQLTVREYFNHITEGTKSKK